MWETRLSICRLGLFQDSGFAGDLEDSKSTSGRVLCIFGSRTFVPTSWMCQKQTSVSHSSTESEVTSLDAGLRMDGTTTHHFWNFWIEVSHSSLNQLGARRKLCRDEQSEKSSNAKTKKHSNPEHPRLTDVDFVTRNAKLSHFCALLYVFEEKAEVQQCDTVGKQLQKGNLLEKKKTCWTRRKLVGEELETKKKLLEEKLFGRKDFDAKTSWKAVL